MKRFTKRSNLNLHVGFTNSFTDSVAMTTVSANLFANLGFTFGLAFITNLIVHSKWGNCQIWESASVLPGAQLLISEPSLDWRFGQSTSLLLHLENKNQVLIGVSVSPQVYYCI
jgi:hypothetical protein